MTDYRNPAKFKALQRLQIDCAVKHTTTGNVGIYIGYNAETLDASMKITDEGNGAVWVDPRDLVRLS